MKPSTRIALLSTTGSIAIAAALAWSHFVPNDPRDVRSIIIAGRDTLALHVPDTVKAGIPFDISFSTFGGGCVRAPARTAVTMSQGTAVIQPYDHHIGGHACPRDRFTLSHSARVRFDVGGVNIIRIAADRRDPAGRPETKNAELVKTVIVCDCRTIRQTAPSVVDTPHQAAPHDSARGITFVIDTTLFDENAIPAGPAALRGWSLFASIRARVTVAASKGRMDILWTRGGPSLFVDSAASAAPLGRAGDYYLFDSTSVVLVRPRSKSFTRFAITGDNYNHEGRRDGWPAFFDFAPFHVDTVPPDSPMLTRRREAVQIFWHSDALPAVAIARGSLTLVDAPMSEMNVARWFGAARDLAHFAESGALPTTRVTVTAAIPRGPGPKPGVPMTFILKAEFVQLHSAEVDVASLGIPAGYRETPAGP